MILKKIYNYRHIIYKKKLLVQFILLATSLISLSINPISNELSSNNLLYKNLEYPFDIEPVKFKDNFQNIKSPANTILIICDEKFINYFDLLYGSIQNIKINYREVVLTTNRSVIQSKYFVIIYLTFGTSNYTKISPLSNFQPNSDLAYISKYFFPNKYKFSIYDLINIPDKNFGSSLYIEIEYSRKFIKIFCRFIRALIHVENFTNGIYFYVPLIESYIDIMQIFPFCLLTFLVYLIDWIVLYKTGNYLIIISNVIVFFFLPFTCIFSMLFYKERAFLCLMYFFINFRYGFVCFVILYIKAIKKIVIN